MNTLLGVSAVVLDGNAAGVAAWRGAAPQAPRGPPSRATRATLSMTGLAAVSQSAYRRSAFAQGLRVAEQRIALQGPADLAEVGQDRGANVDDQHTGKCDHQGPSRDLEGTGAQEGL